MATLVLVLLVLVAVALVVASLRALVVTLETMRLTCRLKAAARTLPEQASPRTVSGSLATTPSCYPPIRVLYLTKPTSQPSDERTTVSPKTL